LVLLPFIGCLTRFSPFHKKIHRFVDFRAPGEHGMYILRTTNVEIENHKAGIKLLKLVQMKLFEF
jgi:hypothetical protein